MDTAATIAQYVLAAFMLIAGLTKALRSKEQLRASSPGMAWTEQFSERQITLIGVAEVLGALGLTLPRLTGVLPWLTPVAALALAVTMLGAVVVHARRRELAWVVTPAVLLAGCLFVAWARLSGAA
ncbi:DoxX family protein [Auraticoccus sp. F435]|uniref:DoxX family protein n=1 Tax=Auraticoccus cholistanensis TaxID=2656650 RepID=A0A6A9UZX3_9ACTN|nr:DoxX family protein [Auraticoccus cholistanensis]MVA74589.1 DoxX family protein [Auraticoccus cholistanensis]